MKASTRDAIIKGVAVVFVIGLLAATITLSVLYAEEVNNNVVVNPDAGTTVAPTTATTTYPHIDNANRINCYPEKSKQNDYTQFTKEQCESRGCTFDDTSFPRCYMAPDKIGYKMSSSCSNCNGKLLEVRLTPLSITKVFDPPIANVVLSAYILNDNHLHFKIEDMDKKRYEVPFTPPTFKPSTTSTADSAKFSVLFNENPFTFKVIRKDTGTVLFDTSLGGFIFSDRFLQISTRLPSTNFYGLGEQEHATLKHNFNLFFNTLPMFARDVPGLGEWRPLYGVHPMYMVVENDGYSHGLFLMNSNAMEYSLIGAPGVVIRTIGGIFDFHLYMGPGPSDVVEQHTEYVGRPYLPPYWSLGFHLARWGYNHLANMTEAIERTRKYQIPLDVIYADIDHMDQMKDFTLDEENFGGLPAYLTAENANNGLRSVIILDPAVTNNVTDYEPWTALSDKDTFIKWENGTVMMGYVWPPGDVAFPDFFLQRTEDVWTDLIVKHSKVIPFDGVWIDMNEPSNFGTNLEKPWNWPEGLEPRSLKCPESYYDDPPYRTFAIMQFDGEDVPNRPGRLSDKTLCMVAVQNDGKYKHYDVHSLYGWSQSAPTVRALEKARPGKRGFVLSRSTFAGSGHYLSHWLGDNAANWNNLKRSVITMLEMGMFGMPHTGPDICGFFDVPTPELCKRWMQLGAFYPYSRNHNSLGKPPQDPGYFGPEVADAARDYLQFRYKMLPYLYTLFYYAHVSGTPVARPLFFDNPLDQGGLDVSTQFMLGPAFMFAPIVTPASETASYSPFIPSGYWVMHHPTKPSIQYDNINRCREPVGAKITYGGITDPVLFQQGGSIAVFQSLNTGDVISTQKTRLEPFNVVTVLGCTGRASGKLFWDDGESIDSITSENYWLVSYSATTNGKNVELEALLEHESKDATIGSTITYSTFTIYNIDALPEKIAVTCPSGQDCPLVTSFTLNYSAVQRKLEVTLDDAATIKLKINSAFSLVFTLP